MDDPDLVQAVTGGDQAAFQRIVEQHSALVFQVCYRILGAIGDAEDAAQESFVIAYRALGTYRAEGSLAAWLARIAARQAIRRAGQRRTTESLDPAVGPGARLAGGHDPLAVALEAERQRAVRRALVALAEPYREVVILRFFAGLSLEEIAGATGRPLNTVKTHLRRGLERLRVTLEIEATA